MELPSLLKVRGLSHSYNGVRVLDDVELDVRRGEFVALVGADGAGKSTLIRCLAGKREPSRGTVLLSGCPVSSFAPGDRRRIAWVRCFGLNQSQSAFEAVLASRLGREDEWRIARRAFSREDRMYALECLDRVGLVQEAGTRIEALTGDQRKYVAIARGLAQQPELIVADELVGLQSHLAGDGVLAQLAAIASSGGLAVVCSLQDVALASRHADRLVGMAAGRVVFDQPADSLAADAASWLLTMRRPSASCMLDAA